MVGYAFAYLIDAAGGAGLVDLHQSFLGKTAIFLTVAFCLTVRRLAALELAPAVEAQPRRRRERLRALRRVKIARGAEDLLGERRREDLGVVRPERREAGVGHRDYGICAFRRERRWR